MNQQKIKFTEIHPENEKLLQFSVSIIKQQLPNMPNEYIEALICDESLNFHTLIMSDTSLKSKRKQRQQQQQHIGCISYRLFPHCKFAEIAFCCILTKFQRKGYGEKLMKGFLSKLKQCDIDFAITYADNDAIGYFEKQGFEMGVEEIKREIWHPKIYHYNGGQIMSINRRKIQNKSKLSKKIIKTPRKVKNNKIEFESLINTQSFQAQYNIKSPPKIITNTKCDQYLLLSPISKMTPNKNWRSVIKKSKNNKKNKSLSLRPCNNDYQLARFIDKIQNNEQYKIVDVIQYIPTTHSHFTRSQRKHSLISNDPSLCIKLKYTQNKYDGNKYKFPSALWIQITNFIERECLKHVEIDEICRACNKIWRLKTKFVKSIIKEMNKNRQTLYYQLNGPKNLKPKFCFILPINETESTWNIQIFQFEFKDGFDNLWGYNLYQTKDKTISGQPNLFDSFYISPKKTCIKLKENMLIFTNTFQINERNKGKFATLPKHILQELYLKDYPQLRYCLRSCNPLFRKFIHSFT